MTEILFCPVEGDVINLDKVADEVFSSKMLGDGIAVIPKDNKVISPVNGVIHMVYETQHAIGITTSTGDEILIHMGIDTALLKGKPFNTQVKVGDTVKVGSSLTIVDWHYIQEKGYDTVISIIAINKKIKQLAKEGYAPAGMLLFEI